MIYSINSRLLASEPLQRCKLSNCCAACCLHGVWVDLLEAEDILHNSQLIQPYMASSLKSPQNWFEPSEEIDEYSLSGKVVHSQVIESPGHYGGTACIFLREDYKCSLQVAGENAGFHPWRFKPFYCILHPLDLDAEGKITIDSLESLEDEPASCLRPAEKPISLIKTFEPELRYLLGDKQYNDIVTSIGEN